MTIRLAKEQDINKIKIIYDKARRYMIDNGNPNQWDDGYPSAQIIQTDIAEKNCYVVEEADEIVGTFVFIIGEEPTYQVIEQGMWRSQKPYGTIHRIASSGKVRGFASVCFDYCKEQIDYLRIDTHQDNKIMQNVIMKTGFEKCGIIHVRNGERIAYDNFS